MAQAARKETVDDENALIRKIIGGAREEYEVLVVRYQEQVFRLIVRQVGDQATARELAQDTFVRAFDALPRFKFQSTFETWVTSIALNVMRSYFSSRRYKELQRSEQFQETKHERQLSKYYSKEDSGALELLRAALQALPSKYREVIALLAIEGKERDEVAKILGIPTGTVASRMHNAISLMRKKLRGDQI